MNWDRRNQIFLLGALLAVVPAVAFLPAFVFVFLRYPTTRTHFDSWRACAFPVLVFAPILGSVLVGFAGFPARLGHITFLAMATTVFNLYRSLLRHLCRFNLIGSIPPSTSSPALYSPNAWPRSTAGWLGFGLFPRLREGQPSVPPARLVFRDAQGRELRVKDLAGITGRVDWTIVGSENSREKLTMTLARTVFSSLVMIACIANAGATDMAAPKLVVYLGATLLDGTAPPRANTAIVTRGDRVVAVQSADGFHAEQGQEVVDVHGMFVIPGLINTHVHLATLAEPLVAKAYLRRELYSGVTTVRDMAGDSRLLAELKREAEFDEIASPDIFFAALMAGPEFFVDPRTHDSARGRVAGQVPWMQAIKPDTNLQVAVAEARGTGATAIKIYGDLSGSLVTAITAEAHRQNMLVWAHSAVLPALPSEVVSAGVDVISHACLLGYEVSTPPVLSFEERRPVDASKVMHPNPKMDALLETIRRRGTILDATLYTFEGSGSVACPQGTNDFIAAQAYRVGIPISTGTDDDAEWKDPDSALDTELELLVGKIGMTPAEVLRAATAIGARTVGLEKDLGSIEAGKLANMVVLRKNPLENIANIRSVVVVVKHGIRYPHGDYKAVTAEEMKH